MITGRPAALMALGAFGLAVAGLIGQPSGTWPWYAAGTTVAVVMLVASFLILMLINGLQHRARRGEPLGA